MKIIKYLTLIYLLVCVTSSIFSQDLIERTTNHQKRQHKNQPKNRLAQLVENTSFAAAKTEINSQLFTIDKQSQSFKTQSVVTGAINLALSKAAIENLYHQKPETINLQVPVTDESSFTVQLVKVDVKANEYILRTTEGIVTPTKNKQLFYRGIIENDNQSLVAATVTQNGIRILASDKEGNYLVAPYKGADKNTCYITIIIC